MKKTKSIFVLLLIAMMVFTFAACGSNNNEGAAEGDQDQTQTADDEMDDEGDSTTSTDDMWADNWEDDDDGEDLTPDDETVDEEEDEDGEDEEENKPVTTELDELKGDYTGIFMSNTGTSLNLGVRWAAEKSDDDNYDVTIQYYVNSYSVFVGDRANNVLKVKKSSGTEEIAFKTKEISKEENTLGDTLIGESKIKLTADELASGVKIEANWKYGGTYSGQSLPEIVAKGEIKG